MEGINALLSQHSPPLALFPSSRARLSPLALQLVQDFGSAQIMSRGRFSAGGPRVIFENFRLERTRDRDAWRAIFDSRATTSSRVHFDEILTAIGDEIIAENPPLAAARTAAAFNAFYSVIRDPHTYLVPSSVFQRAVPTTTPPPVQTAAGAVTSVGLLANESRARLGYIKLANFMTGDGPGEMRQAVTRLTNAGVTGLVLDLRGNVGGRLDWAVDILSLFVPQGETVVSLQPIRRIDDPDVLMRLADLTASFPLISPLLAVHDSLTFGPLRTAQPRLTQLPLVVLVDAVSASASELVSGALQDLSLDGKPRAIVVGAPTFGKGTAQRPFQWPLREGVLIFKTTSYFVLPSGRTNQLVSVLPDIEAYRVPNPTPDHRFAVREADLYVTALPHVGLRRPTTHENFLNTMRNCVSERGTAKARYESLAQRGARSIDYQLLVAQDTLLCRIN